MAITRYTVSDNQSLAWSTVNPSDDDLVLMLFVNDGGDQQTTPSDFTRLDGNYGNTVEAGLYYRICTGAESGNIITDEGTFGVSGEAYVAHVIHIPAAEWHGSQNPEDAKSGGGGATGTLNPPNLTVSWGSETDNLWFVFGARDDDDGITAAPTNYTNFGYTGATTQGCEVASAWRTNTSASEDPGTFTQNVTNEEQMAYTCGVRPSSGQTKTVTSTSEGNTAGSVTVSASKSVTVTSTSESTTGAAVTVDASISVSATQATESTTAAGVTATPGTLTEAVTQATEGTTADNVAVTATLTETITQASEADTATAVTVNQATVIVVGQATEGSTATSVTATPGALSQGVTAATEVTVPAGVTATPGTLSQGVTTATESTVTASVTATPGTLTETVTQATEADTAQTATPTSTISVTVTSISEADSAQNVTVSQGIVIVVGQATESSTAAGVTATPGALSQGVTQVTESTVPAGVTVTPGAISEVVTQATEADSAQTATPTAITSITVTSISETDSAQNVTVDAGGDIITVTATNETNSAASVTATPGTRTIVAGTANESSTASGVTAMPGILSQSVTQATESNSAQSVTVNQGAVIVVGQATESSVSGTVTATPGTLTKSVTQAVESNSAHTVAVSTSSTAFRVQHINDYDVPSTGGSQTLDAVNMASCVVINTNNAMISGGTPSASTTNTDEASLGIDLTSTTNVNFDRQTTAIVSTRSSAAAWEYTGNANGPNEFKVRGRGTVTLSSTTRTTTASCTTTPTDIDKCVVFVTGIMNTDTGLIGFADASCVSWLSGSNTINFERGGDQGTTKIYYTVVEFTGSNWTIHHGFSGDVSTYSGTINLYDGQKGTGTLSYVAGWSKAFIYGLFKADDDSSVNYSLGDLWPVYDPGGTSGVVNWELDGSHDGTDNQHLVYVIENDDTNFSVARYNSGAITLPVNDHTETITSVTSLTEAICLCTSESAGGGTTFLRGYRNSGFNSTSEVYGWCHTADNTGQIEFQVIDLNGMDSGSNEIAITADDLQALSEVESVWITQKHILTADDLNANSEVSTPTAGESHVCTADDLQSLSEVSQPGIEQTHNISADDLDSVSEVSTPNFEAFVALLADDLQALSQVSKPTCVDIDHPLLGDDLQALSEVSTGVLEQIHIITADDLESNSEITTPVIAGTHILLGDDLDSLSSVSTPDNLQAHNLLTNDLESVSRLSRPHLDYVGIIAAIDMTLAVSGTMTYTEYQTCTQAFKVQHIDNYAVPVGGGNQTITLVDMNRTLAFNTSNSMIGGGHTSINEALLSNANGQLGIDLASSTQVNFDRYGPIGTLTNTASASVIEYVGNSGGPNEIIVRGRGKISISSTARTGTATTTTMPSNIDRCVVFITGFVLQSGDDWSYYNDLTAVAWMSGLNTINFERGSDFGTVDIYYTVVEFLGSNWTVHHGFSGDVAADTGTITLYQSQKGTGATSSVSAWNKAFIYGLFKADDGNVNGATGDLWPVYENGVNNSTVTWEFDPSHDGIDNQHLIYVVENTDANFSVARYNSGALELPQGNHLQTITAVADINQAFVINTCETAGGGTWFLKGYRNSGFISTTQIYGWCHQQGNEGQIAYQVINLSGMDCQGDAGIGANSLESASEVSTPTMDVTHTLTADDLDSLSQISTPAIAQKNILLGDDMDSLSEVSTPAITITAHTILADDLQALSELSTPQFGERVDALADDVQATSEVSTPAFTEENALLANDLQATSEIDTATIGQVHALSAGNYESASEVSTPTAAESNNLLLADDLQALSQISTPAFVEINTFVGNDFESASEVSTPQLATGNNLLLADNLQALSEVSTITLAHIYNLLADDLQSLSEVGTPTIAQVVHAITADDLDAASEVSSGVMTQKNELFPDDLQAISEVSQPGLGESDIGIFADDLQALSSVSTPGTTETRKQNALMFGHNF